jgi:CHAT domain-containing protein/Tfp pilus assembly protein PilF
MTCHNRCHSITSGREWEGGGNYSESLSTVCVIGGAIQGYHRTNPTPFLILLLLCGLLAAAPAGHALADHSGFTQQPAQQPSSSSNGTDDEKDIRTLEPGKPIKRELAGAQQHTYQIELGAGQFLKVIVEQDEIDVVIRVVGTDGKQVAEFDSESRPHGEESAFLVTEAAGCYQLVIRPKRMGAPRGRYEIRIGELRPATENDRALFRARSLHEEHLKLRSAGKFDEAIPLVERVLEIREKILGPEHRDVAAALNDLAILYDSKGDHAKAEPLYLRSLAIAEKTLGPEHPDAARALSNLALLYSAREEYGKAEPLYKRALAIAEKALGPEHPYVAIAINNLGIFYSDRGEYAKAEPLYLRALAIWEKALGPEHPNTASTLNNLAVVYTNTDQYAKAEPLYLRALAIREKVLGPEHPELALPLNNLANLYRASNEPAKAEPLYLRGLAIREKALGPEHLDVGTSLNNLANLYCDRGEYDKAEPLYLRALAIWEKARGPKNSLVFGSLNDLAMLYVAKGDIARALAVQSRANVIGEYNLALNLTIGSERQRLAFLATLSGQASQTISLHLRYAPNDPTARDLAATMILQRKGRALDATSENLNALRGRFDSEDQALLDQLTNKRSEHAKLIFGGARDLTAEQYSGRIKELEDEAERYETEISRRSNEFRAQSLPVTLGAVQAAIPVGTALIEFGSYYPFDAKAVKNSDAYGPPHYVAYILRPDGEIQWKELGKAKPIDRAISTLREALRNPNRSDVKRLARAVDKQVFQPIRPLVGELTRLLISPDGPLSLIPFAALVDEQGHYLVERYSIGYLTSGRDLLRLQVARESKTPPLVVANPDFGIPPPVAPRRQKGTPLPASTGNVREEPTRNIFNESSIKPLYYTAKEGEALRALFPDATLLTKRQATKEAINQIRSPKFLHIATHGFFLDDLKLIPPGGRGYQSFDDDPEGLLKQLERSGIRIESPLLRSGLALAGANEHKEEDNGILTALEVTGLNLWGTKLVVLSACDTGVGEVKNGDGVYGLRRALVLAGSETQVMSLWAVSDKATRDLMVNYYGKLKQGEGRSEALRQVQLEMLKKVNQRHPYYWASFIQSGEWANLEGKR